MQLDALVRCYHELTAQTVDCLAGFYAEDAYFKDPFNEVRGREAIQRIFAHMFTQVAEPRFVVTESVVDAGGAMLVWAFHYRARLWGPGKVQVIRGTSHLKFDAAGKVIYHRDYWDTAEELYMKVPVLGPLIRGLRRVISVAQPG